MIQIPFFKARTPLFLSAKYTIKPVFSRIPDICITGDTFRNYSLFNCFVQSYRVFCPLSRHVLPLCFLSSFSPEVLSAFSLNLKSPFHCSFCHPSLRIFRPLSSSPRFHLPFTFCSCHCFTLVLRLLYTCGHRQDLWISV